MVIEILSLVPEGEVHPEILPEFWMNLRKKKYIVNIYARGYWTPSGAAHEKES